MTRTSSRYSKPLSLSLSNAGLLLVGVVALLCLAGFVALHSASLHVQLPFFRRVVGKQLLWSVIGGTAATAVFLIQKKFLFEIANLLYWGGLGLIVLPFLLGRESAGTMRWLHLGFFNLQPSEIMKICVILAVARYLASTNLPISDFRTLIVPLFMAMVPMAIVLKQPDLGTSIIFIGVVFPMLYWAGARVFHIFIILAPLISVLTAFNFYSFFIWVVILIVVFFLNKEKLWLSILLPTLNLSLGFVTPVLWNHLEPYQQNRILTLFNVEADPQGAGYQVLQSQIAIGSGGVSGKGIGRGTQTHLKFLPEQHNDFIFSVVGEEYGFIGVVFVLLLYFFLFIILINLAFRLRDRFSALVIIGVTSVLFMHVFINVAMTIGLMPVTGLPLPFLSYGGSFLLSCLTMIGLVLNMNTEKTG